MPSFLIFLPVLAHVITFSELFHKCQKLKLIFQSTCRLYLLACPRKRRPLVSFLRRRPTTFARNSEAHTSFLSQNTHLDAVTRQLRSLSAGFLHGGLRLEGVPPCPRQKNAFRVMRVNSGARQFLRGFISRKLWLVETTQLQ